MKILKRFLRFWRRRPKVAIVYLLPCCSHHEYWWAVPSEGILIEDGKSKGICTYYLRCSLCESNAAAREGAYMRYLEEIGQN